jgi:hypothetical protein
MMNPYSPPAVNDPPRITAGAGTVSDLAVDLLRQTRPWVMFLSVLAFLGSGLMMIAGLGVAAVSLAGPQKMMGLLGLVYVPVGLIYVYPAIKMWSYGGAIARLAITRQVADLEHALGQQKSLWKFLGIAMVVMMAVYFVAIGVGMAAALIGRLR